ncbi:MAG: hypothetical protein R3E31_12255 [Chloroflexota bacterium]
MAAWKRLLRRPVLQAGAVVPPASRWPLYVGVTLAVWLSYYLYAGSLGLPFLQEDSTHILWMSARSPWDSFVTAVGDPAYRPLGKALIKCWYLLLGHHDIAWLRFHNITFNVLSISLVGLIASWLDRGRTRYLSGGVAALFFAALPFAYQAIPWINNFFYPLENLLLLAMTAVYWQARQRHSNMLLGVALFLSFLAPFEIEYGVMSGGILFALEVIWWWQKRQPYPWLGGVLFALLVNSLYVLRWLTIPKQAYGFGLPTLNRIFLISTYFLQGLMYPIAPLARPFMSRLGLSDIAAIWLVCLPALILLVGYLLKKRQWAALLLGGFWFVLLNMPALVFVNFDYVVNGPRLLYPPGVGIAWLWGTAVATFARPAPKDTRPAAARLWQPVVTALFLLAVLAANSWFVRDRVWHYRLAERPIKQLNAAALRTPPDEQMLVVNFPSWITPKTDIYAMGHHGAAILPFYIGMEALIAAHNEQAQAVREIQFLNVRQEQPYYYGMLGETVDYDGLRRYLAESGDVYLTQWQATQVNLAYAGRVTAVHEETAVATFGDQLAVALTDSASSDDAITLTLTWQLRQKPDHDLSVFVHLYGADGQLITQADGYPLLGLSPFWLWEAGQTLRDQRTLTLPDDAPPPPYHVAVGIYDPVLNMRLAAVDANGAAIPDDAAVLLVIEQ